MLPQIKLVKQDVSLSFKNTNPHPLKFLIYISELPTPSAPKKMATQIRSKIMLQIICLFRQDDYFLVAFSQEHR